MKKIASLLSVSFVCATPCYANLPDNFSYIKDHRMIQSMNYATKDNFVGRKIEGYHAQQCILTKPASAALIAIQDELDAMNKGYALKIFDCYRPTTAVADFEKWSQDPKDIKMKSTYYPDFDKPDLFKLGYIADKSGHSRGSTIDLTITVVDAKNPKKHKDLEMGTIFDFFGEKSHTDSKLVSAEAQKNRIFFKEIMEKHGFKNYEQEWWHFSLNNEPFPDTYFDFPVK